MHLRTKGFETSVAALSTHIRRRYKFDRVLFYECDHRADKLIGLKVDVSGEFITDFELVFVQENHEKIPHLAALFSEPGETPSVANSNGHF